MQQNELSLKKLAIDKCLILLVFSAFLPAINFYTGTFSAWQSLQEFALNVFLFVLPVAIFWLCLEKNIIAKNQISTQILAAVFAYIALFAYCFFNAIIFIDVLDFILGQYIFGNVNVVSFTLRWLVAIALFCFLTNVLVKLFTYVRVSAERN